MEGAKTLYWEAQESGFCGVHCINSLLQGAYFTEVNLSEIALEMDAAEKQLMMEMGTETRDFLKYMAQDSENVNQAGFFSIQVLEKALGIMGLQVAPLQVTSTTDPTTQEAIVCNLRNHWFAIRKLNGHWFNLNSLFKDGPQVISTFYLSAFLKQLLTENYSIFVVTGKFPTNSAKSLEGRGQWFPISTVVNRKRPSESKSSPNVMNRVVNFIAGSPSEDDDLARALELSKRVSPPPRDRYATSPMMRVREGQISPTRSEDEDLARAIALSKREQ